ncbi:MAG: NADH-quinone oxidoreductase subunit F [Acidobacteria bacterium]|nr:MAG: NADH-quinone oxidoreductase subunit F [Acidobacteriota bacterium]
MILFPEGKPTKRETFDEYRASGGYEALKRNPSPAAILEEVADSGLRGRGGAGYPVGKKWAIAAQTPVTPRYIVCNAGEDEPGSFKDRVLLEHRPHLVLEGMILAARAIPAEHAYLYLNETYHDCFQRFTDAVDEAQGAGLLHSLAVSIHGAPTVYVAGEDSAALEVLEGKPPLPRQKPPYPAAAGLFGKPTVVNNVETFANVPSILRSGAAWFRTHGTAESPGTMIFCLGDEMNHPGAYELPLGSSLRHLYEDVGGGLKEGKKLKAVLPGGPSCAFLPADRIDVPLDPASLQKAGSSLGCGVMRFYSTETCMVEETLRIAQFFARESCGQCPACRMETNMLSTILDRIHQGKGDTTLYHQFQKILDFNRGKGYCALINMPGPPITSAIRLFQDDFNHHLRHGTCPF